MSALVVIPARYSSTRFPGKPLAPLAGKPMIQHVYERAAGASRASAVVVATDDSRIYEAVVAFGGKAVMTAASHASGTDRVAEAARDSSYDIIVNVQGDEPMIRPEIIDAAVALLEDDPAADIGTLARKITDSVMMRDPNVVKAAVAASGFALYFSRAPIPYDRDHWVTLDEAGTSGALYQHIGIYSYRRGALMELSGLRPSPLEQIEKLEQLRALEHGMRIKVAITDYETIGVDTPEDLERVGKCLSSSS